MSAIFRRHGLILPLFLTLALLGPRARTENVDHEFTQTLRWSTSNGLPSGTGINYYRQTVQCIASRLYFEADSGDRISLTSNSEPRLGVWHYQFTDEKSGWSVEYRQQINLRFADSASALDLDHFIARVHEMVAAGEPFVVVQTLRATGDLFFEKRFEGEGADEMDVFLKEVEAEGFAYLLSQSAPEGIGRTVRATRSHLCDPSRKGNYCTFSGILTLLDEVLSRHRPPGGDEASPFSSGEERVVALRNKISFEDEDLAFLSAFPSFDRSAPLSGTCAEP